MKHARSAGRILRIAILFAIAVAIAGDSQAQSPWTQEQGEGFFQISWFEIGSYDRLYQDSGGDLFTSREITESTVQAYGEYGVADRLTLLGSIPFKRPEGGGLVASSSFLPTIESGSLSELGNVQVGARYRFTDGDRLALSGQLDLELPTGEFDPRTGLSTGYDAYTLTPLIAVGRGWDRAYVSGYAGLGLRSDDFSNDWRLGGEVGYSLFGRLWLIGLLDVRRSFSDGDVALTAAQLQTGLYVNDQEFVAFGGKALLDVTTRFGLHFTYQSAAEGNLVPRSPLVGFGAYLKLR